MDKDAQERLIEMQETLFDIVASITAIKQSLYRAKVTDPETLQKLFQKSRQEIADSPAGQRLEVARTALALLKGIG